MLDPNTLPLPRLFEALCADGALDRLLLAARREDLGDAGDVTTASLVDTDGRAVRAAAVMRTAGTVSGLAVVEATLRAFGAEADVEACAADGDRCDAGAQLFRLAGPLRGILAAERTLLNLIGRASGIATLTACYVKRIAGTGAVVCDTRKTTPGLRFLEKYAVRCGGGTLHRFGLHDAALFKDNHLAHLTPAELASAVTRAATAARARHALRFVEVEVDDLEQFRRLLECPPGLIDIVLLDNMSPERIAEAVAARNDRAPGLLLEASGGVDLAGVRAIAEAGVDRIAVGAITHHAVWLDVALEITG